jgi:hypothetical protein
VRTQERVVPGTAIGVARMARFSVRSGSFERSLDEVIPLNEAV